MKREIFIRRTLLEASAEEVFHWHTRPGVFERLTPPWERVEVVERKGGLENGARVTLRMRVGPFSRRWVAEHRDYQEGRQFRDVQIEGPFAYWEHTHRIEPVSAGTCYLEDHIVYTLPGGCLGRFLGKKFTHNKLERLFGYRHRITKHDIALYSRYRGVTPMKIMVTGSSGLIGSALVPLLTTGGHQVTRLVRTQPKSGVEEIQWDPSTGRIDPVGLEGADAVVHLAGENIASGRWTPEQKAKIRDSRVEGTHALCEALSQLTHPPKTLLCASAIGYYGDRGGELLQETSPPGTGFLAEVCRAWEAATAPAKEKGMRVVHLRFGMVLSTTGGALAKMLLPFKLGVGGIVGNGRQYWSWITLDDTIGAIHHALMTDTLHGPVNVVAPHPVTNYEFTKTLGRVLNRPTLFPVPAFAARLAFGEMADALLLASTRVAPTQLSATGYVFRYPELEGALRHLLGRD